jgi:glucose/arabinose dehydrogenase
VVVRGDLPPDDHHGWKYLRIGPDNKLYVPQGVPCNVCETELPYGTIMRMNLDGSDLEIIAQGVRNSVGFDWDPVTGDLWFTDNGRDWISDDLPPDELNHITAPDQNFGFPYCHGGFLIDVDFGTEGDCEKFTAPAQNLGPHVAPLGMIFYTGSMFPDEYRHQIILAEHGSWNRSTRIGYRLALLRVEDNEAVAYEGFAEGFLDESTQEFTGRPVALAIMADGSLQVSDDFAGAIYRISYDAAAM